MSIGMPPGEGSPLGRFVGLLGFCISLFSLAEPFLAVRVNFGGFLIAEIGSDQWTKSSPQADEGVLPPLGQPDGTAKYDRYGRRIPGHRPPRSGRCVAGLQTQQPQNSPPPGTKTTKSTAAHPRISLIPGSPPPPLKKSY
jgi:hypothetical protein